MQEFPHHYIVSAAGHLNGDVVLQSGRLPALLTASPAEFGGPGDLWSPEALLVGAVADCFILTFRAIAAASKLPWKSLDCEVTGTLDRVNRVIQFTAFSVRATLRTPEGVDVEQARQALVRSEQRCLITASLKAPVHLETVIDVAHGEAAREPAARGR